MLLLVRFSKSEFIGNVELADEIRKALTNINSIEKSVSYPSERTDGELLLKVDGPISTIDVENIVRAHLNKVLYPDNEEEEKEYIPLPKVEAFWVDSLLDD